MVGLIIIVIITAILLGSLVWLWIGGIKCWDKEIDDYEIGPFNTPEKKNKK